MRQLFTLCIWLFAVAAAFGQTTCPPNYVPRAEQNCPGAIRLCRIDNSFPDNGLCGRGTVQDSFRGSCGTSEHITSFYQFTARRRGDLRFLIIPNDITGGPNAWGRCGDLTQTCASTTDYDWVLYKLPAGSDTANGFTCSLINVPGGFGAPNPYEVACDFSGTGGVTGMYDSLGAATGGVAGNKFDLPISVDSGDFFILVVDNFRATTTGYKILFGDPTRNSALTDVRNPDGVLPSLTQIRQNPNCYNDTLIFTFDKGISCARVNPSTFRITNANFPAEQFPITSITPADPCIDGVSKRWKVTFSNIRLDTAYRLNIANNVEDACGNVQTVGQLRFKYVKYLQGISKVGAQLATQVLQDSVCSGDRISIRAKLDTALRNATLSAFTYRFFEREANGQLTPIPGNGFAQDSAYLISGNPATTPDNPIFRTFRIAGTRADGRGCNDTTDVRIKVNPTPQPPTKGIPALCFGETANIALHSPTDTGKYVYTWTSSVPLTGSTDVAARLTRAGNFTLRADTVNAISTDGLTVSRGETDAVSWAVAYKRRLGGCRYSEPAGNNRRQFVFDDTIRVGAYIQPLFAFDTIIRPGKSRPTFILPLRSFYDESVVRYVTTGRTVAAKRPQAWTVADNRTQQNVAAFNVPAAPDTAIYYDFRQMNGESNYTVTQTYTDTVANGKICTYSYARSFEVVLPDVPNVLSRNDDGQNDYFEIPDIIKVYQYRLTVFNRWGRKVYEQGNYDNSFNGIGLEDGVYFYNLKPENGPGREYRGWLELRNKGK